MITPPAELLPLLGRAADEARVSTLLETGQTMPAALLLLGDPGAGKTALLDRARERAERDGYRVLSSSGGLEALLRPLLSEVSCLPAELAAALEPSGSAAAGLLRTAVLLLLGAAADRQPVLLLVDDLHDADPVTLDVLAFVIRGLHDERIAILLAARGSALPPIDAEAGVWRLGPLAAPSAAQLLDAQPDPPSGWARAEILRRAAGNPLVIIELARAGVSSSPLPLQDEAAAAEQERAATEAHRQARFFDAAKGWQRAAELSPVTGAAARRYTEAVLAAYRAGEATWVVELYDEVASRTEDADLLAAAACAAGLALGQSGEPSRAFDLAAAAVRRRPRDGQLTVTAISVAATAALLSGAPEHRQALPGLIAQLEPGSSGPLGQSLIPAQVTPAAVACAWAIADPPGYARSHPDLVSAPLARPTTGLPELARLLFVGSVAWLVDDSAQALSTLRPALRVARETGMFGAIAVRSIMLVSTLIDRGLWAEADEVAAEVADFAAVGRMTFLRASLAALQATLSAYRGDPATARQLLQHDPAGLDLNDNRLLAAQRERAHGLAALADGDPERAYRHFRALAGRHYFLSDSSIAQFARVAVRTGRAEEARGLVAEAVERLGSAPTVRMAMLLSHAQALLDDDGAGFRQAVDNPAHRQWPLEHAQAQLDYGHWLLRRRRPLDARDQFAACLDTFVRYRVPVEAEQARMQLRNCGTPTSQIDTSAFAELTPRQQQIARLAADGLGNQEIAQRLFMSPRTIGSNLYRIYPVLGVSRRHQLRDVIPSR